MTYGRPPFRADHVGSLLRSPELLRAREQHQQGTLSAESLRVIEDRSIRDVVKMQEEMGLQGITDGEYRRTIWHADFLRSSRQHDCVHAYLQSPSSLAASEKLPSLMTSTKLCMVRKRSIMDLIS